MGSIVQPPLIDRQLYRFVTEMQIGAHLSLQRDVMGSSFLPKEIRLTYPPADDFRLFEERCKVRFEQPANQFIFDRKWMDKSARWAIEQLSSNSVGSETSSDRQCPLTFLMCAIGQSGDRHVRLVPSGHQVGFVCRTLYFSIGAIILEHTRNYPF
jgi:hypothetical protein